MLIATFYSFLPIVMQNEKNAKILLNDKNLLKSMSLFDFSREKLQSNENLIIFLSHYLVNAISSPIYNSSSSKIEDIVDLNGSFRFLKLKAGNIIYNNQTGKKDTIVTDPSRFNIFACNRPFLGTRETYFEIKINKIGSQNIFIGFIDSRNNKVHNGAFGFGSFNDQKTFCRRANYLSARINTIKDDIMAKEENKIEIKDGDSIGCYFTQDFIYLTKNGKLTPYRLFHESLDSYFPLIIVDHDHIKIEINHNVSIIDDSSNDKFGFLKNIPEKYFEPNDFESIEQDNKSEQNTENNIFESPLIGSRILIKELVKDEYRNNYATIRDIKKDKMLVEAYNSKLFSTEMIEIDNKLPKNTTYLFNIVENATNTKLSYNTSLNMSYLPDYLQIDPDLNKIKNYLKNRTIKENSRSIAVIMTRYLVFILVDYLRYSKSKLLQEEGIKTKEMQNIIKSLAYSLPTITSLSTVVSYNVLKNYGNYLIFNEKENKCKLPGLYINYSSSFKAFLKQSEKFISPQFYIDLLQSLFDISNQNDSLSSASSIYELIKTNNRFESVYPLPKSFNRTEILFEQCKPAQIENCNIIGAVPILISSIPDNLPCVKYSKKTLRYSSDQISYLELIDLTKSDISISWRFNQNNDCIRDYRLKLGLFILLNKLDQRLLDGHFGFIQIIILFLNTFNPSDRFMKDKLNLYILDKIFEISEKRNPLIYPFIKPIILILTSVYNFSDVLLTKKAERVFSILSYPKGDLYPIKSLPYHKNESYFIFSIYSKLIQAKNAESSFMKDEIDLSSLFDVDYSINSQIFSVSNEIDYTKEEGFEEKLANEYENTIFKDYNYYYLLFYYSILCNNDNNLPYPMFLFYHERIR